MSAKHAAFRLISRFARELGNRGAYPPGLRVLLYHSVGGNLPEDPYGTSISKDRFIEHLDRYEAVRGAFPAAKFLVPTKPAPAAAFCFDDGYRDTLTTAAPLLTERNIPFTVFIPPAHTEASGDLYLGKAELIELSRLKGARIGAHGDRHVPLTDLDDGALKNELGNSRKRLEDMLGIGVDAMSYPFGAVNRRVRDAAQEAGFSLAGCSLYGANLPDRDPLLLKRTEIVAADNADDFEMKLRGHWDWFALRQGDPAR